MAKATPEIVRALRNAAKAIKESNHYQWGHMGSCNCGFLAQEVTSLTKKEIHTRAMQKYGDWNEQLNDYCPTSGLLMDDLISKMIEFGFDSDDLKHLEQLSDPNVLSRKPKNIKKLSHNVKRDVVLYMNLWADYIEESIIAKVDISEATIPVRTVPV